MASLSSACSAVEYTTALAAGVGVEPVVVDTAQHSASSPATPTAVPEAVNGLHTPCKCSSRIKALENDLRLAEAKSKVRKAERDLLVCKVEHRQLEVEAKCRSSNDKSAAAAAEERAAAAERRAVEAERSAVEAERRAVEAERRAVEAEGCVTAQVASDAEVRMASAEDRAAAAEKLLADVQEQLAKSAALADRAIRSAESVDREISAKEAAEEAARQAEKRADLAEDEAWKTTRRLRVAEHGLHTLLQQSGGKLCCKEHPLWQVHRVNPFSTGGDFEWVSKGDELAD